MAGQTTWNKATVPAGTDPWNGVPDWKKAVETAGLVFGVANVTERNGLAATAPGGVLPIPTMVYRADVGAYETWDGTAWLRGGGSVVPAAGAGWTLTGSLVRTKAAAGTQVSAAFKAIYGGGTFTLNSAFVSAFTLSNTGYLPVGNDAYGYFMLRAVTTRNVKADCAFTIDSTGAVYVRTLLGQAATTIVAGDELSFNTVWNA